MHAKDLIAQYEKADESRGYHESLRPDFYNLDPGSRYAYINAKQLIEASNEMRAINKFIANFKK